MDNIEGDINMTFKLDPTSMVAGVMVAVVILLVMGVAGKDQDVAKYEGSTESFKEKLSSVEQRLFQKLTAPQKGRFQLRISGDSAVILDTATGQAWRHTLSVDTGKEVCPVKLQPIVE